MGEQIPLASRIFAVADTLDAMTSDRPYRRALPFSAAWQETNRESGWQFDPNIVLVFRSIPEQAWENIRLETTNLDGEVTRTATSKDLPTWMQTAASEWWPKRTRVWAKDNDRRRSPKARN
jgi:HD-GYP domain-containing protein (c-di-GMP phosphodiesterase class II)